MMPLTIAAAVHSELLIRKSRFIGRAQPMTDRAEAQKVVADLRANTWALRMCAGRYSPEVSRLRLMMASRAEQQDALCLKHCAAKDWKVFW